MLSCFIVDVCILIWQSLRWNILHELMSVRRYCVYVPISTRRMFSYCSALGDARTRLPPLEAPSIFLTLIKSTGSFITNLKIMNTLELYIINMNNYFVLI